MKSALPSKKENEQTRKKTPQNKSKNKPKTWQQHKLESKHQQAGQQQEQQRQIKKQKKNNNNNKLRQNKIIQLLIVPPELVTLDCSLTDVLQTANTQCYYS